jgi:tetratricopeptide (TPR) repeat protein
MDSVLNNTLAGAPDFSSREATAFFIILKYFWLLIFPYNLSCDYSFSTINIQTFSNPIALIAIILCIGLLIFAFMNIKKKSIVSFGILFFLISFIPVSNIFILIGATMAERFMYVPSFGFCIIVTYFLIRFNKTEKIKCKFQNLYQMIIVNSSLFVILFIIIGLYSIRTFSRNSDWKDNATIYAHDSEVSENSASMHYCYGHELFLNLYQNEKDPKMKSDYLDKAIIEFSKAVSILPTFRDAYYFLGKSYNQKGDIQNGLKNFEKALNNYVNPDAEMLNDLGEAYLNTGNFDKALIFLDSSIKVSPDYYFPYDNKGIVYMKQGKFAESIPLFKKSLQLYPKTENALFNLGCVYFNLEQYPDALETFNKALELDSTSYQTNGLLGLTYANLSDSVNAKYYSEKSKRYKKK